MEAAIDSPNMAPAAMPMGALTMGFMGKSVVTSAARPPDTLLHGGPADHAAARNAVRLCDFGDGRIYFIVQFQIPPTGMISSVQNR